MLEDGRGITTRGDSIGAGSVRKEGKGSTPPTGWSRRGGRSVEKGRKRKVTIKGQVPVTMGFRDSKEQSSQV